MKVIINHYLSSKAPWSWQSWSS